MSEKKNNTSSTFNPIGLCIGLGVGLCFGAAMGNMGIGIALGMGIGLCYCVALGRHTTAKKDHQEDKQ